ncbi:MAG: TIGR03663 family protein [bacterium]|nr:TIGR03663 family protein [bacterium]
MEVHTERSGARERAGLGVDWLTIAFWGTVLLACCLRFYDLASMPLHHDESLYGVYSWRFFTGQGYSYDPMMHGPFMFHFQLVIFFLFGVGDFSVRIAPAFLGTLLIAGTWLLKDWIGKVGILLVALLLTFSPTHLYFSRFMRHDSYVAFFTYMSVIFGIRYYRSRHKTDLYLTAAALSLMFCVKENAYIHAFIFMTFVFLKDSLAILLKKFDAAFRTKMLLGWLAISAIVFLCITPILWFSKAPLPAWVSPILTETSDGNLLWIARLLITIATICVGIWVVVYYWCENTFLQRQSVGKRSYQYPLIFAAFLFFWIYLFLYSSFFTNKIGVWDGFSRSWVYWWNQHSIQRIKGPFHYYIPFFVLYELPVLLIAMGGVLYKISSSLNRTILTIWATVFSGILIFFYGQEALPLWMSPTHMEDCFALILACYVLFIGLWGTIDFLKKGETLSAFFTYWSAIGFLIYSYAGEKVPWLFLHIMLPLFVLAGIFLRQLFQAQIWRRQGLGPKFFKVAVISVGAIFCLYTLHTTIWLNYQNRANPVERIVYTQTSTDVLKLLEIVEDIKFGIGSEEAKKPIIAVQGNAVWPLHWYLRNYEGWYYPGDLAGMGRPLAVIDPEKREEFRELFEEDYQEIRVKLREWWIPGENGTMKDWWKYFLYRDVFSPLGSSDMLLYVRRTLSVEASVSTD